MAKRKPEALTLGLAAAAGVVYLAAGAALAAGGFFAPHSLAREAGVVSAAHAQGHPFKALFMDAHSVLMTGHTALAAGLHLAMLAVHTCFYTICSVFGL